MGWKTSCILASTRRGELIQDNAIHNVAFADEVAKRLPGDFLYIGESTFEKGAYPREGSLYIGAYPDSLIIAHSDFADSCFENEAPPVVSVINEFLPDAQVLALQLHSVVNLYAYALFENGKLIRARAGSGDDGVFMDVGQPLPEEIALFARATTNEAGEQVWLEEFDGVTEELDHSSMGEEFVFEVSRRFFGERYDCFDHNLLTVSAYKVPSRTFWQRLTGRS